MGDKEHEDLPDPNYDLHLRTVDQVLCGLEAFTDDQRSLAWSPQPRLERAGASDCRPGGSCGLNFNADTCRSRWSRARYRWNREQKGTADR
jgi:hypothetical protein